MRTAQKSSHAARRTTIAMVGGAAALAIVGSLLSATAAQAAITDTYRCTTTLGGTALVDFGSTGTGLVDLGSTNGVVGIATGSDGLQVGLLGCTAVAGTSTGSTQSGSTLQTLHGTPVATSAPSATTTETAETPATDGATPSTTATTAAPEPSATTPAASTLDSLRLTKSATTVYPAAKGYQDSIRFSVMGLTATASGVKITGTAVLTKGAEVVKSWKIDSTTTRLTWNGRIGKKVRAGVYTLTVTAWSADGAVRTSSMKVLVSSMHLVTRTASVRTRDLSNARSDKLPSAVAFAWKYGAVTLRIHTKAKVSGPASLLITGPNGERISIPLKNGKHVTKSATLPQGFTAAKFTHVWKKGDAKLLDLYTVFTFKQLV